nr:response regulator [Butyrivibrio sp.]
FLAKNMVDLILLDYEMPVTNGPQVLEMLRSEPSTSTIPVMFLTAKGDKESVLKVVALKPEKYLLKTMPPAELISTIDEFFASHK